MKTNVQFKKYAVCIYSILSKARMFIIDIRLQYISTIKILTDINKVIS